MLYAFCFLHHKQHFLIFQNLCRINWKYVYPERQKNLQYFRYRMPVTFERKKKRDCKHSKLTMKACILILKNKSAFKISETI